MPSDASGSQPSAGAEQPPKSPESANPRTRLQRWALLGLLVSGVLLAQYIATREPPLPTVAYSDFFWLAQNGKVATVAIKGRAVRATLKGKQTVKGDSIDAFTTMIPAQPDAELFPTLRDKAVDVTVRSEDQPLVLQVLFALLPWILIIAAWTWISRRGQSMLANNPLAALTRGRTRRYEKESQVGVKFDDVAGLKAAKQDLAEIVDFLKEPERFARLGGKVPRGVLLVGPPGTGKTLLARAVAGEAGVAFFSISGSEFIEMFVGVGASRVRTLFDEAKKVAPSIVFIDEIDAIGRSRGTGMGGGHDEREQTLNQLLSEMDGFVRNDLTVVLAATNRPDVLDSALLRPGRFDRRVIVDRPERAAREAILALHARGKPLGGDVELESVAANTPGFSGADLANLVNEAALCATRRNGQEITAVDFSDAYDKIVLGDVRETRLDPEEKRRVAVHESGHAVLAHFTEHTEPLERVSILPRGMALGVTHQTPSSDKHIMTQPELEARLNVLMGGYAAEGIVFGSPSSGAESDLKRATELAFKMVAHFGMSDSVGPVFHEHRVEHPFLGQTLATEAGTSDATVHMIEQEARAILVRAQAAARATIEEHRDALETLISALLATESVDRSELERLLGARAPISRSAQAAPVADASV